jgi:O-antigen/teichoic acid export membrane protein
MNKVYQGLAWMGGLRGATRVITFIKLAVLARLLSPVEFGLFGIASLVLALLETLTDTGINIFFIQKEGELKDYLDTAWIVSILRGVVITLVLVVLSRPVSLFFNSPSSQSLLLIIALAAFLRGFINPAIVSFQKNLEFNKEFYLRFATVIAEAVVSIGLSILTKSAVALVWGMIASVVVEILISFIFVKPTPRLSLDHLKIKKVFHRGKWITAAGVFQYLFANGDNIIVGKLMDTYFLGLYQMAYRISTIPITEISDVFSRVTLPVYANITLDKKLLKKTFLKSSLGILLITLPVGLIIFIFTKPIVELLLGQNWIAVIPALKVLSIFGVIRAMEGAVVPLFLALKKQEYVTSLTLVSLVGLGITIVPLVRAYGILGASYSAMIGTLVAIPVIVYYLRKVI